jgi:hypothetical protein
MGHYAFLDENNIVTEVITGRDENEIVNGVSDWETYYGNLRGQVCKRTSYNTIGGVHKSGGTPFRKNFAGAGYIYDETRDAFYWPQPYPSWTLNETSCIWEAPVPYPDETKPYKWNETTQEWIEIN